MPKPGAKAIVFYKGKILLVLRDAIPTIPHPNTWNTPGGGIEAGESPEQALLRELEEEICLKPSTVIEMGTTTYSDGSIVYRFFVPVTEEEFSMIRLGNEGQRIGWFTQDEIRELQKSPERWVHYETHKQDIHEIFSGRNNLGPRSEFR